MPEAAPFLPQEVIRRKRDGAALTAEEIGRFIAGVSDGSVGEGQVAAFAMAVFFRGMTLDERVGLTRAMAASGTRLDWTAEDLGGPVLDKHSTGGVGDKVSLILAPVIAACGGFVPMISGRGLGHTGGTLDKMDAIPGYVSQPDLTVLRRAVRAAGCAIVGATADLAPADRRMYAVRDVTATVESLDLITASILSKKLAAGLGGLVMDVKVGSGAFLPDLAQARALAQSIATVATGAGLPTVALLTDMNQVLGRTAGNALEVAEAIEMLAGAPGDPRLRAVTLDLAGELLVLGRLAADPEAGRELAERALADGSAGEAFQRMVAALGGPTAILSDPQRHLARAPVVVPVMAGRAGVVGAIDVRALGLAVVALGGGRVRPQDAVDHRVGLAAVAAPGEAVEPGGRPLAMIHAVDAAQAAQVAPLVRAAMAIVDTPPPVQPLIAGRIAPDR